jgi:hypothetical protein
MQQLASPLFSSSSAASSSSTTTTTSASVSLVEQRSGTLSLWLYRVVIGSDRHSLIYQIYRGLYRLLHWRRFAARPQRPSASSPHQSSASSSSSSSTHAAVSSSVVRDASALVMSAPVTPQRLATASSSALSVGVASVITPASTMGTPMSARCSTPIVSAGGMEEDEPGLRSLFEVDVALLSAEQLRMRMADAQRAFTRQNARLAHLRASRKQALQVMEAESRLRSSAEQSIEVLESELARLRARNTVLADQLHAREVQINRLGDLSNQPTPRVHLKSQSLEGGAVLSDGANDARIVDNDDDDDEEESDDASRKILDFGGASKPTVDTNSDDGDDDTLNEQTTFF